MLDQRNVILAIVLSVAILLGWNYFFGPTPTPPPQKPQQTADGQAGGEAQAPSPETPAPQAPAEPAPDAGAPQVPGGSARRPTGLTRAEALDKGQRVTIRSPRLHGSIALKGGRLDDLTLADYRKTPDPESPEIVLLSPQGAPDAYFAQFGWVASEGVPVPGPDTVWQADGRLLEPGRPVTLSWNNGQGLVFKQTFSLDEDYMFSISQSVENVGGEARTLYPYSLLSRHGTPEVTQFIILHEGMLGVFDETLEEVGYDDLKDDGTIEKDTTGGWLGITDKYWLTALIPDQEKKVSTRFLHTRDGTKDKYQADYLGGQMVVGPGESVSTDSMFFAGAKEVKLLDRYAEEKGIDRFDLAIDFGWFYFLTKPIFYALLYIHPLVGNFGVAILLLTVGIKLALFPLANKSYTAMSKMKKLQPQIKKMQERFGDDKMRLNQEMMALYKREKVNPASGCLPILVQIPVFFALYKVLFVTIEMRHAPFFGWIQDLSAPDPTSIFNLFGVLPFTPPDFLMIGVWPLIMGVTMWLQQKLNPQPADAVQAKIFMVLPIVFTFLLARFPAGLVIYWAWNNALSIAQQWVIMRKMGVKS